MKKYQTFESHGRKYQIDQFGAIHQIDAQPFKYDMAYVQTYNSPEYLREAELLQTLRFGYCTLAHGARIDSILDVGYGAGQFMRFARKFVDDVYGSDVTGIEIEGCTIGVPIDIGVDVVTFWDCLEHIQDLIFLRALKCQTVIVSLPYCHIHEQGKDWFDNNYPHRKPDEHIRHFTPDSLARTMRHYGWKRLPIPHYLEDVVRKSKHNFQNILTMGFKR